jgi:Domain of Unknown Function (DUF1543)
LKLFAFYVGGETENSNVELHDIRFAVGDRMEDCYESLRKQWWGTPKSLHIDCWMKSTHADGHAVQLRLEPFVGKERLFFANLGGYDMDQFTELHSNVFVIAPDKDSAKKRSLSTITHWTKNHRDTLFEVEHILGLDTVAAPHGLHVHLTPSPDSPPPAFVTGCYIKIGLPADE